MNRRHDEGPRLPDPRMIPQRRSASWRPDLPVPQPKRQPDPPPAVQLEFEDPVVRPFVLTGGRTTPLTDGLRIETIVVAPPSALGAPLRFEQRTVVQLCQQPQSIAEVSAALKVPVGVVKVIVSDLMTQGYISAGRSEDVELAALERIRDLVRSL